MNRGRRLKAWAIVMRVLACLSILSGLFIGGALFGDSYAKTEVFQMILVCLLTSLPLFALAETMDAIAEVHAKP